DLVGPGVNLQDVMLAVDYFVPLIEIADQRAASFSRSEQMVQVCNAFNWGQVIGTKLTRPAGVDLRYEGMVISHNGRVFGSAAAVEVLGNPLNAVVFLANKLAEIDQSLKAGMMVQTGSIIPNFVAKPGDHV